MAIESLKMMSQVDSIDVVLTRCRNSLLKREAVYHWAVSQEPELPWLLERFTTQNDVRLSKEEARTLLMYYTLIGDEDMCKNLIDEYEIEVHEGLIGLAGMTYNVKLLQMYLNDYITEISPEWVDVWIDTCLQVELVGQVGSVWLFFSSKGIYVPRSVVSHIDSSMCFPTIFTLGLVGLGPCTKREAGLIIQSIIGGACLPPV
jgi:hypothetical protein